MLRLHNGGWIGSRRGTAATAGLIIVIIVIVPAGFGVANGVGRKLFRIDDHIIVFHVKTFFIAAGIGFHRLSFIVVHAVDRIAGFALQFHGQGQPNLQQNIGLGNWFAGCLLYTSRCV